MLKKVLTMPVDLSELNTVLLEKYKDLLLATINEPHHDPRQCDLCLLNVIEANALAVYQQERE